MTKALAVEMPRLLEVRFLRHSSNLVAAGQGLSALFAEAQAEAEAGADRPLKVLPGRARRLTDLEKAELARDYVRGMTVYELAEKFSIRRQTVSEHLHRMGVTMRQKGLSESQIDKATELYIQEGLTLKQVGAKLGADAGTVRLALLRRGVRMREPVARKRDSVRPVVE
ncbi:hypothetical protein [Nocardia wallacei]|uniref:hypothetical protein n=1 Tax=Nocardia wallacei TaxID=480035 RepID=UPI002456FEAD|nr:hypothetical protein [Nocardia wallacei]